MKQHRRSENARRAVAYSESGLVGSESGMRAALACLLAAAVWLAPTAANAVPIDQYELTGSFELPAGAGPFDIASDGRLVVLDGDNLRVETAPRSRDFPVLATLPAADIASFGAAFLVVSPDGLHVAVGNNGGADFSTFEVGVFTLTDPPVGEWYAANHFAAAWLDNRHLAVSAGAFGQPAFVTALDTQSLIAAAPLNPVLVSNIGGASGGVALDAAGRLFTGNGFTEAGPSLTGDIRAVSAATWQAVLNGAAPVDYEVELATVLQLLSASPLSFDADDNLAVGGGDSFGGGDSDFVGLVSAASLAAALSSGVPIDTAAPSVVRRLDPVEGDNFYSALANVPLDELYVRDFGADTVFVYAASLPVPLLGGMGHVGLALALGALGLCAMGGRRRSLRHSAVQKLGGFQ